MQCNNNGRILYCKKRYAAPTLIFVLQREDLDKQTEEDSQDATESEDQPTNQERGFEAPVSSIPCVTFWSADYSMMWNMNA